MTFFTYFVAHATIGASAFGSSLANSKLGHISRNGLEVFDSNSNFIGCLGCPSSSLASVENPLGIFGQRLLEPFNPLTDSFSDSSMCYQFAPKSPRLYFRTGDKLNFVGRASISSLGEQSICNPTGAFRWEDGCRRVNEICNRSN